MKSNEKKEEIDRAILQKEIGYKEDYFKDFEFYEEK